VDPHGSSDHWGTVCTLDLARTDLTKAHVHWQTPSPDTALPA